MKNLSLLVIILLLGFNSFSQQEMLSTMYWNVTDYFNPAATGIDFKHRAIAQYRNQWDGVNGAPNTLTATYGIRLDSIHSGIGFAGSYDAIGFNRMVQAGINYSYHFRLGKSILGVGVMAGIMNMGISPTWVPPVTMDDSSLPKSQSVTVFNSRAGVYFRRESFFAGASIMPLNAPVIGFSNGAKYSTVRNLLVTGGYLFPVGKNIGIEPSFLAMSDFREVSLTATATAVLFENIRLAAIYRTSDAIGFSGSYDILGKFRIAYAYDLTLNKLSGISRGSHEIAIGFLLR